MSLLDPDFVKASADNSMWRVGSVVEAQGIMFQCPVCFVKNSGPVGTHYVLVWFADRNVPEDRTPKPRWKVTGSGVDDLTLTPSIHLTGEGCGWHGWIQNGEAS